MTDANPVRLRIPDGRWLEIGRAAAEHPMFGVCDTVRLVSEPASDESPVLARFQAVDWSEPQWIPPLDRPGALPPGAGTAILNLIARRARRPLRYRGPYPTAALFDSLLTCFRVTDPAVALAAFTADVEQRALRADMSEVPVAFTPAPFERLWHDRGVCVQRRDHIDAIYIRGRAFSRLTRGARRVRRGDRSWDAVVELGDTVWTTVVRVSDSGQLLAGPEPLPAIDSPLIGQPLPAGVRAALAEVLPARAPELLKTALNTLLGEVSLTWDDTGDDLARTRDGGIQIHALLPIYCAEDPKTLMEMIATAVEPIAQRLAQLHLMHLISR